MTVTDAHSGPIAGPISRLDAQDGLYLRAEHLNRGQDYARRLAYAIGQAGGPGVIHGFDVSIATETVDGQPRTQLNVTEGLAVNTDGRPLLSTTTAVIPLDDLTPAGDDSYWEVTLLPDDSVTDGDTAVHGLVCDDGCDGTRMRAYRFEGLVVALVPTTEPQLGNRQPLSARRPWLAARLFAAERERAGTWTELPRVFTSTGPDFAAGARRPEAAGVKVAVLLKLGPGWDCDPWTVRRERAVSPPVRFWEQKLGMRPLDVFLAQVLQFQSVLATRFGATPAGATPSWTAVQRRVTEELETAVDRLRKRLINEPMAHVEAAINLVTGNVVAAEGPDSLRSLGFTDLPPAGFLPTRPTESLEADVAGMFGPSVAVRFCRLRPGDVPGVIEQARHRDRIPLSGDGDPAAVDVFVPVGDPHDPDAAPVRPWVAFTRAEDVVRGDRVDIYLIPDAEPDDIVTAGVLPEGVTPIAEARYPAASWSVPETDPARFSELREVVRDRGRITLIGLAGSERRRSLAGLRASLLLLHEPAETPPDFALRTGVLAAPGAREAIVVVTHRGGLG